jgi:hypothetical protein
VFWTCLISVLSGSVVRFARFQRVKITVPPSSGISQLSVSLSRPRGPTLDTRSHLWSHSRHTSDRHCQYSSYFLQWSGGSASSATRPICTMSHVAESRLVSTVDSRDQSSLERSTVHALFVGHACMFCRIPRDPSILHSLFLLHEVHASGKLLLALLPLLVECTIMQTGLLAFLLAPPFALLTSLAPSASLMTTYTPSVLIVGTSYI